MTERSEYADMFDEIGRTSSFTFGAMSGDDRKPLPQIRERVAYCVSKSLDDGWFWELMNGNSVIERSNLFPTDCACVCDIASRNKLRLSIHYQ
jgi:hypothetical protein